SNAAYVGINRAMADVAELPVGEVPVHLRDASYRGAASLGHGEGYLYPHDFPDATVEQDYRPEQVRARRYYEPTQRDVHQTDKPD
ncbi:MAG: replication-associated recombination protein A, partial [Acidimicrobiia bacterium]|nr:replication-associated recombination protein A [Acidimicrobiia bacterium]